MGSATYLAYSTVRDPIVVFRTITDQVKKIARKLGFSKGATDQERVLDEVCDYLQTDEAMGAFLAALDVTGDVGKALAVAKEVK